MILLVAYDLNAPEKDYKKLLAKLKEYKTYWHHLDSFWLIKTESTAKEMRDLLKPLIDSNDELLVMNVTGDAAAWTGFTDSGSNWLRNHL